MSSRPQQHRQKSNDLPGLARYESRPDFGPILPPVWECSCNLWGRSLRGDPVATPNDGKATGHSWLDVERSSDLQFNERSANQRIVRNSYLTE
jgi:hypothetical protein